MSNLTDLITDLQSCKTSLVTNLNNLGITVSGTDALADIVAKTTYEELPSTNDELRGILRVDQIMHGGENMQSMSDSVDAIQQILNEAITGTKVTYTITFSIQSGASVSSTYWNKYIGQSVTTSNTSIVVPVGTEIKTTAEYPEADSQTIFTIANTDKTVTITF